MASQNSTRAEDALIAWGELKYREDSLGRDAEEREWQEETLFYQRRQWLEWKEGDRRFTQLKPSKSRPRPMPVSNYYAKTVNANANQLGAQPVRVAATPKNDDPETRRAADYAEMAKDAIDVESGIRFLNPLLAKHVALWGIGVTKDTIDTDEDAEEMEEQEVESNHVVGCLDCGEVNDGAPGSPDDQNVEQQNASCPSCGSMQTASWTRNQAVSTSQYVTGKGKIKTEVRPIFEIYLPRDIQNANLSPRVIHRYRKPISMIKRKFGDKATDLKSEDSGTTTAENRFDTLRSLTSYTFAEKLNAEQTWITEVWTKWDELPRRLQQAIEEEYTGVQDESEVGMTPGSSEDDEEEPEVQDPELDQMKIAGIFFIYSQGRMLQWGANPLVDPDNGEKYNPFTFFLWDIDPASVYPKGIGADLVPLQKRLNRLDSLIELAMMTNSAGKWLWPTTQNNKKPPSGDPAEVAEYDTVGDGKVKPEFVQPNPISGSVWQYRGSILQDFEQIGLTLGVQSGSAGTQSAFRTVAYLGAKASEQLNTQRYLWESAHCLRYKKCLTLAKNYWDEDRQVKIAGPNGNLLFQSFTGMELRGSYELDFVPNSSIPKTQEEKTQTLQMMVEAGLVDLSDPAVRQYIFDLSNLEGVNLANELQFRKAERDLEMVKRGEMPIESPYQDWNIELKVVANFTLTEEFEQLDPTMQTYVLAFSEYLNQKVSMIAQQNAQLQMMQSAIPPKGGGGQDKSDPNNKTLAKIPGVTGTTAQAEDAASSQGKNFAHQAGA
jgi:hypothetical protein